MTVLPAGLRARLGRLFGAADVRKTRLRAANYQGGAQGRRFASLAAPRLGVNAALLGELDTLVARTRALLRSNAFLAKAVRSRTANTVGTGIMPRSRIPDKGLRTEVMALWDDWAGSVDADADGRTTFYGLQAIAFRGTMVDGEALIRFRPRYLSDGLAVPLQLQLLEADHLPATYEQRLAGGGLIRAGIEFDPIGRRAAYWLYSQHPNDGFSGDLRSATPVRRPASELLHVFETLRAGQLRGEPGLARALLRAVDKDSYDDAVLQLMAVGSLIALFVTSPNGGKGLLGEADDETEPVLEPGTISRLGPGEEIKQSNPPSLSYGYKDFQHQIMLELAAACGVTFEQLSGDLSNVNYSSIRAGLVEFRREAEQLIHGTLVPQLCTPVWQRFLDTAVAYGMLRIPDYAARRREYQRVDWIPQGWAWVDPQKELEAAKTAVRCGFTSRSAVIQGQGNDPETVDAEIAADQARADALELVFDSDGRRAANGASGAAADAAGSAPAAPPAETSTASPAEDAPEDRVAARAAAPDGAVHAA